LQQGFGSDADAQDDTCDVGDDDGLLCHEYKAQHAAVGDGEPGKATCDD
jgi:hypothetical protein